MNFKKLNTITAWAVFAIAALTYTLTIEPTVSFWDCGEFITSAYKLEVGHPPGAPFFMLVGNFFSALSFGNEQLVPVMLNMVSALSSAFTILFLFWTITHIARRIATNNDNAAELSTPQTIAILGSGIVGALAYTFSDTFWFSAVEGEVYAMSSLFTAVVFWAILKWENVADQKYANRWLILIAYLMGLSIGVHLLNLLVIPAIVLIYYFKKHKTTPVGIFAALAISGGLLLGMMYGIIPGIIWFASRFELIFTNGFGMPYNLGTIIYAFLLLGVLATGLFITHKKAKPIINLVILSVTVIVIGYSSYSLIIIRSLADTPMNQNKPDNVFALQSYLNREQYGQTPLVFGEYFNSQVEEYEEGKPIYALKEGKYEVIDHKTETKYDQTTFFPRLYSSQPNHIEGYKRWAGIKNPQAKPKMAENLRYFFKYQVGFMYFRYFMWNFAGRQNDIQGHGNSMHGNWISGIAPFDNARLNEKQMPDYLKENRARNKYYFLPLLLGLAGAVFMFMQNKSSKQYSWAVLTFFLMTGLAIIFYLNQPPFQPRERDYAYAGSFYVFAIYIGLGVLGLFSWLKDKLDPKIVAISATALTLLAVPTLMAFQNFDDHNRSGRYTALSIAKNYLNSCDTNAVIFTNGDNDTFPLWYAQEVEGVRTDVRVVNLSYLNTDWYAEQMSMRAYESDPLNFGLTKNKYEQGTRDVIYFSPNNSIFINEKYENNKHKYEKQYKQLFDTLVVSLSENSVFPQKEKQAYEKLKQGHQNFAFTDFVGLVNTLIKNENLKKYETDSQLLSTVSAQTNEMLKKVADDFLDIKTVFEFITSDDANAKIQVSETEKMNYLPTNKISIPVDKKKVVENGIVAKEDADKIASRIEWTINKEYLTKSEILILSLLANNNWERPIYFAITVGDQYYLNLQSYFQLDGMTYKLVPIKHKGNAMEQGRINSDKLFDVVMNRFEWGGINNPKVYLDENNLRMTMNMRSNFYRLASALIADGKTEKAKKALAKYSEVMSHPAVVPNYYDLFLADNYYQLGMHDEGNGIIERLAQLEKERMIYHFSLPEKEQAMIEDDKYRNLAVVNQLLVSLRENNQTELDGKWSAEFMNIITTKSPVIAQFNQMQTSEEQLMQWFTALPETDQQLIQLYIFLAGEM